MSRQTTRLRKLRSERAAAEETIQHHKERIMATNTKTTNWGCTAEDIIDERDTKGLSWRQVGINLEIGSPSKTRRAYKELTGKDHKDSQPIVKRAPKGSASGAKVTAPGWDDNSDQDEIEARLNGSIITVRRVTAGVTHEEEIRVRRVTEFSFGPNGDLPLEVHFISGDNGSFRAVRVADVTRVR